MREISKYGKEDIPAMSKKKTTHETKILKTPIPGVKAKINYQSYEDGSTVLSGYLVDAKTGIRHDCDIKASTNAAVATQMREKEQLLIGRMVKAYTDTAKVKPSVNLTDRPYSQAFQSLSEKEKEELCLRSWKAETTKKQGLAYFATTMLPLLDSIGLEVDAIAKNEILEKMQQAAEEHGNYGGNPFATAGKVAQHAKAFNWMYQILLELRPEYGLPEIVLPIPANIKKIQAEQCKALPIEILVKLAAILLKLISNGLAMGGILMLTAMPRTSEACAPVFGDIVFCGDYAVYGVLWQSNGEVKVADLKSKASYRIIILPKYAVDALQMRMDWLREQGFTDEEIQKLPVVSSANDPRLMASPNDLSAYLRELLSLLGCGKKYWEAVDEVMLAEPDMDGNKKPSRDPSAYVLRRNGCTLCCNICGMHPDLVDALMGHKLSKNCKKQWNRYIRRPENWPIIAEQMERVIYDPRHSANPAFKPILLQGGMDYISKSDQMRFCFMADPEGDSIEVELVAETLEAGDSVILEVPNKGAKGEVRGFDRNDAECIPILGAVQDESFYMEMIREADSLDLGKFMPNTPKS